MKRPSFSPSRLRLIIQTAIVIFFLYIGWEFINYYLWATGASQQFTPRPPAVEGFLPISALLGLKRLLLGGGFDPVHPAGLSIFLGAMLIALIARKGFCGYLCPVGWACARLGKIGKRLGISRTPGPLLARLLSLPKYLLLIMLVWPIATKMGLQDLEMFINSPFNKLADTHMMLFFLEPSTNALVGIGVIVLGSMIVPGFWCRGFCPYGALLGLFSLFSPLAVRRNKEKCTYCRRCLRACPVTIRVHEKTRVGSPECQGCLECVSACPEEGCLEVRAGYGKKGLRMPFWSIPALTLLLALLVYAGARANGVWESRVNPMELKMHHMRMMLPKKAMPPGMSAVKNSMRGKMEQPRMPEQAQPHTQEQAQDQTQSRSPRQPSLQTPE